VRATARIPIPSFLDSFLNQRIVRVLPLGTNPPFELLAKTHPNQPGLYRFSPVIFSSVAAQHSKATLFSLS
jgi:hypothetical protein